MMAANSNALRTINLLSFFAMNWVGIRLIAISINIWAMVGSGVPIPFHVLAASLANWHIRPPLHF